MNWLRVAHERRGSNSFSNKPAWVQAHTSQARLSWLWAEQGCSAAETLREHPPLIFGLSFGLSVMTKACHGAPECFLALQGSKAGLQITNQDTWIREKERGIKGSTTLCVLRSKITVTLVFIFLAECSGTPWGSELAVRSAWIRRLWTRVPDPGREIWA